MDAEKLHQLGEDSAVRDIAAAELRDAAQRIKDRAVGQADTVLSFDDDDPDDEVTADLASSVRAGTKRQGWATTRVAPGHSLPKRPD